MLAAVLSTLVGVALGLFGGGGSILTVPILVYAAGLDAQTAIATSLLVVGITSLAALVPHARAGNLELRTGLIFGSAGMFGAFFGGRLAQYIPAGILLGGFGVMMLATAVAMFRQRPVAIEAITRNSTPWSLLLLEGAFVGLVTGMVGAGGGFLVVPALVMLGGLSLSKAVGTSLLVIAMKSSAGFVGYLGHVSVPWALAGSVALAATLGAVAGQLLGARLDEAKLRRGFAAFVVVMAVFVLSRQLPLAVRDSSAFQALFVQRWPFWIGGAAVALVSATLLYFDNHLLGVSTGCSELCRVSREPQLWTSWRVRFIGGIALGGLFAALLAGRTPSFDAGLGARLASGSVPMQAALLLAGGLLIGFGARVAGGCTSGHGIVGVALGSRASMAATAAFLAAGFATTWLLYV